MTAPALADHPPWLSLPAYVVPTLRPHIDEVVTEVVRAVPAEVPEYARPIEGSFGAGLRRGVTIALDRFLDLPGSTDAALSADSRRVYTALGRGEYRSGRQLGALLAAYRSGARVTFRWAADLVARAGGSAEVLVPLGESIFAYIDELSAASVEGYAEEQNAQVGELERRRAELAGLLLRGRAVADSVPEAAAAAGWHLPESLVVVVVPRDRAEGLRLALGRDALVLERAQDVVALVPAPSTAGARRDLERALRRRRAVVGPARAWQDVPESLRLTLLTTARVADLEASGHERPDVVVVAEHLAQVALAAEPGVLAELAEDLLRPLADCSEATRARLVETLYQWLLHWGQRRPVAEALSIHPQTVGYRVGQLREAFGDTLEDARTRFELLLVLHAGHGRAVPASPSAHRD